MLSCRSAQRRNVFDSKSLVFIWTIVASQVPVRLWATFELEWSVPFYFYVFFITSAPTQTSQKRFCSSLFANLMFSFWLLFRRVDVTDLALVGPGTQESVAKALAECFSGHRVAYHVLLTMKLLANYMKICPLIFLTRLSPLHFFWRSTCSRILLPDAQLIYLTLSRDSCENIVPMRVFYSLERF